MRRVNLLIFVLSLFGLSFLGLSESQARMFNKQQKNYLLSFEQLQKLPEKQRVHYLKSVARIFVHLSKSSSGELSWIDMVLSVANADGYQFRCIGGGFPVEGNQTNCGVSEFMGFSCPGQEMCNPLIFGLKANGQPHCYDNATTSLCYNSLVTGRNSFFTDEWFQSEEAQTAYNELKANIDSICSGSATVQERLYFRQEACRMVERQTALNSQRSLNTYAVISEENRGTTAPVDAPDDATEEDPAEDVAVAGGDEDEGIELAGATDPSNPCSDPSLSAGLPLGNSGDENTVGVLGRNTSYDGGRRDCDALGRFSSGEFTMPPHLGQLRPVRMGNVTICVMPDYISVGSDSSNTRLPLGQNGAIELARETGFMLPTTAMVDAIYQQADIRLTYDPRNPTGEMTYTHYFMDHDDMVDTRLSRHGYRPGQLIAGHKKDVVLEGLVESTLSYYGWNYANGSIVQPYRESSHGNQYSDYSHGVRFVSQVAFVDGRPVDLREIVNDSSYPLNTQSELAQNDIDYFEEGTSRANSANGCYTPQNSVINPSNYTAAGGDGAHDT